MQKNNLFEIKNEMTSLLHLGPIIINLLGTSGHTLYSIAK